MLVVASISVTMESWVELPNVSYVSRAQDRSKLGATNATLNPRHDAARRGAAARCWSFSDLRAVPFGVSVK